jgi:HAD superfamily hydrolase (TIGR01509 family)
MTVPRESSRGLCGVFFDMDGLLVDSEPQWFAAEARTVAELGGQWGPEEAADLLGSNLEVAANYMIAHTGTTLATPAVMQMLLDNATTELARGVQFRPGALALVDALADVGIPVALVTSSVRTHVEVVLEHLKTDPFQFHVTADDVSRLKPHPEPYLTALDRLGLRARSVVVLEDSPTGVAAAEAAGCHVVAVPSEVAIAAAPGRTVIESLTTVDVPLLESLVTRS